MPISGVERTSAPWSRNRRGAVFHAAWESRVLAMTVALGATGRWNIDMSRAARETLPNYLDLTYYEIWLGGVEKLLIEKGLVTADELTDGRARHAADAVARVLKADQVAAVLAKGSPTERPDRSPRDFARPTRTDARDAGRAPYPAARLSSRQDRRHRTGPRRARLCRFACTRPGRRPAMALHGRIRRRRPLGAQATHHKCRSMPGNHTSNRRERNPPPLDSLPGLPRDADGPVFEAPWQAHAFAMTLSLHERGVFTWSEWASALSEQIIPGRRALLSSMAKRAGGAGGNEGRRIDDGNSPDFSGLGATPRTVRLMVHRSSFATRIRAHPVLDRGTSALLPVHGPAWWCRRTPGLPDCPTASRSE